MTLSHALILASCTACVECFAWCLRWRNRRNAPMPSPMELVIVFVAVCVLWWVIDSVRFAVWVGRNLAEWVAVPVRAHAAYRWQHRKLRRHTARHAGYFPTAGNVLTAGAVRQLPTAPALALPAPPPPTVPPPAAQTVPAHAVASAAVLVRQGDGSTRWEMLQ